MNIAFTEFWHLSHPGDGQRSVQGPLRQRYFSHCQRQCGVDTISVISAFRSRTQKRFCDRRQSRRDVVYVQRYFTTAASVLCTFCTSGFQTFCRSEPISPHPKLLRTP